MFAPAGAGPRAGEADGDAERRGVPLHLPADAGSARRRPAAGVPRQAPAGAGALRRGVARARRGRCARACCGCSSRTGGSTSRWTRSSRCWSSAWRAVTRPRRRDSSPLLDRLIAVSRHRYPGRLRRRARRPVPRVRPARLRRGASRGLRHDGGAPGDAGPRPVRRRAPGADRRAGRVPAAAQGAVRAALRVRRPPSSAR